MTDVLTTFSTKRTPQHRPADERQVPNHAGGFVYSVTDVESRLWSLAGRWVDFSSPAG